MKILTDRVVLCAESSFEQLNNPAINQKLNWDLSFYLPANELLGDELNLRTDVTTAIAAR